MGVPGGGGEEGGLTDNCAVLVVPQVPEIGTDVETETELVAPVKVALLAPGDTVTVAGTVTIEVSPLDNDTTAPPEGAAPVKVTVP
jgi:hypothetical protein